MFGFSCRRLLLGLVLLGLVGCDDSPIDLAGERGNVSILLTDAPGDVAAVWVDITEIYLQGGPEDAPSSNVLLDEPTGLVELTSLAGTAQGLVTDAEVAAGAWSQLRIVVAGVVLETEDGEVFTRDGAEHPDGLPATGQLQCPSCSSSGIKVKLGGGSVEVEEGDNTWVLDFDVAQTFGRLAGNSNMWVMNPVIHASRMDGPETAIEGTVVLADGVTIPECPAGSPRDLSAFLPLATATTLVDGDGLALVRTGATQADGTFHIGYLEPDDYDLSFEPVVEFDGATLTFEDDVVPATVTVVEGETVGGVEFTVRAATCTPTP